ncbi:hypothetical protein CEXT_68731 [Caerostris extrusa]|uniref:Uncharacterized protein n=1 Tax=Caerostris extrusa TaxID=172846 RepID=A0AAV4U0V6_CAEEX|nr:hypothetical protein CEXT_68731 [Caerostris extrusa]
MDSYDNLSTSKEQRKTRMPIISVIQNNQNTKDLIRNNIVQKLLRWNMEEDISFFLREPTRIKETLPKSKENPLCPWSTIKVGGISSTTVSKK